jgi:hypothetical protein
MLIPGHNSGGDNAVTTKTIIGIGPYGNSCAIANTPIVYAQGSAYLLTIGSGRVSARLQCPTRLV